MPIANIRGVNLNYEVLGTHGPWMALSPGGRRALELVRPLGQRMAEAGYRVLVHDRRNCGLSDIAIGGKSSEYETWADDLHELLSRHNAMPGRSRSTTSTSMARSASNCSRMVCPMRTEKSRW